MTAGHHPSHLTSLPAVAEVMCIAHCGDCGAVMAHTSYDLNIGHSHSHYTHLTSVHAGAQVMYIAHCGDSGAVMACTSYDLHFPLRLTTDHKPNRADEHARIQAANGNIDEQHNRVVSEPKPHNGRVTLLSMSRWVRDGNLDLCTSALSPKRLFETAKHGGVCASQQKQGVVKEMFKDPTLACILA